MTEPEPASNIPEYTVSEISAALKRTVEGSFARVRVRGEISGLKRAGSGHLYMSLKDEKAVLDAVAWRGTAAAFRVRAEDGLEVVCEGRLSTYAARSKYQLVIDSMVVAGVGALLALLEERRRALAAEGLFEPSRKKPLPLIPEVIGVVTSPSAAVIRDILHRLADRFPRPVLLWPVLVQGEGAAEQVAAAIRGFNAIEAGGPVPRPDLLIVARGGGSLEDLWPFNEEAVVRAAAESRIPLISAVGHETDTTLIDHAADLRAPTPSAAAEKAVPVRIELLSTLADRAHRLAGALARLIERRRGEAESLARGLPRPQALIGEAGQRLDDRAENLRRMVGVALERRRARLSHAARGLKSPREQITEARGRLALQVHRLAAAGAATTREARTALDRAGALLASYSYRNVLERGFAVVHGRRGIVRRADEASGRVEIEFHDGRVPAQVGKRTRAADDDSRPRIKSGDQSGGQGSLL
jgi:exodeoxyribonuclease VII large subunit